MMNKNTFEIKNKLFVAGVTTGAKMEAVSKYFSEYGDIEVLWEPSKHSKSGLKTGHCILICNDKQLPEILLAIRIFKFLGHILTVSEYISGTELAAQNNYVKECRLMFKKVPNHYTEQDLEREISQQFGPVKTVFKFRHANSVREYIKTSQYSVFFCHNGN